MMERIQETQQWRGGAKNDDREEVQRMTTKRRQKEVQQSGDREEQ